MLRLFFVFLFSCSVWSSSRLSSPCPHTCFSRNTTGLAKPPESSSTSTQRRATLFASSKLPRLSFQWTSETLTLSFSTPARMFSLNSTRRGAVTASVSLPITRKWRKLSCTRLELQLSRLIATLTRASSLTSTVSLQTKPNLSNIYI